MPVLTVFLGNSGIWGNARGNNRKPAGKRLPSPVSFEQAIRCDDGNRAAKIIKEALGIESDDVLNYTFPKDWPTDREVRARIIGGWLRAEAQ